MLHAHRLGYGDLHVIDIPAVPYWLENAVREAENKDVLNGLFPQVVIDPVDLAFVEALQKFPVELPGGIQIGPKRLFYDDAAPLSAFLRRQARGAQPPHDVGKELGGRRQVKQIISGSTPFLVQSAEGVPQTMISIRIPSVGGEIGDALGYPLTNGRIYLVFSLAPADAVADPLPKSFLGERL